MGICGARSGGFEVSTEWERWVEAGKVLGTIPTALVRCPHCQAENLVVEDIPNPRNPIEFERTMRCPKCGAMNALLMRHH